MQNVVNPPSAPSGSSTSAPTNVPSAAPTALPTALPTTLPTAMPTQQPSEPAELTSSTWSDDSVISFDGDLGWKIYDAADELTDPCSNMVDCRREDDSGHSYYGPFSNAVDGMYLARRFACAYRSEVSIAFNIASCNVAGTTNVDSVTAFMDGTKVGKVTIKYNVTNSIFVDALAEDGCTDFSVQSFVRNTKVVQREADEKFTVEVRTKVAGDGEPTPQVYLYGFELICDPTPEQPDQTTADSDDWPTGSSTYMHNAYCISGLADDRFNGEYSRMEDIGEDAIEDANGQWAYEKNSYDGVAYFYGLDGAWVVGAELNGNDTVLQCADVDDPKEVVPGEPEVRTDCTASAAVEVVTVQEGECEEHHVVIGEEKTEIESLQALGDVSVSRELKTELLSLVVAVVAVAFVMGMLTCLCCGVCSGKKKPYKPAKVAESDDSDADYL